MPHCKPGSPRHNWLPLLVRLSFLRDIPCCRGRFLRASAAKDAGQTVTRLSAQAKLYASEIAVRATDRAIQIHGGYGFTKDYPVEKFYRDVKLCTIGEGTSEIQKLVIARQLLSGA